MQRFCVSKDSNLIYLSNCKIINSIYIGLNLFNGTFLNDKENIQLNNKKYSIRYLNLFDIPETFNELF